MMRSNNHGCIVFAILALFVVFVNCKSETKSTTATTALPGQDECTWGPTHWCSSVEVAGKCNTSALCVERGIFIEVSPNVYKIAETTTQAAESTSRATPPLVGSNPCTWGPGYWCDTVAKAKGCGDGAIQFCLRQNLFIEISPGVYEKAITTSEPTTTELPVFGNNPCTWGPAYWCNSVENANKCGDGALKHCIGQNLFIELSPGVYEKVSTSTESSTTHEVPVLGSDPCTWGPSFWCKSVENAKKCGDGAIQHCLGQNIFVETSPGNYELLATYSSTMEPVVGNDPCTWGPSYWCDSLENAKKCEAEEHCLNGPWKGTKPPCPKKSKRSHRMH